MCTDRGGDPSRVNYTSFSTLRILLTYSTCGGHSSSASFKTSSANNSLANRTPWKRGGRGPCVRRPGGQPARQVIPRLRIYRVMSASSLTLKDTHASSRWGGCHVVVLHLQSVRRVSAFMLLGQRCAVSLWEPPKRPQMPFSSVPPDKCCMVCNLCWSP